jgi:tRNA1(Val) A37 N6-methylase TrmN6
MSTGCSSGFRCSGDTHFDATIANRDVAQYREKGPGVTTSLLRDLIVKAGAANGDLLDIGCGVGALTFELLDPVSELCPGGNFQCAARH